ncbi:MAG: hypothetical protein ACE141_15685 [Bryobacteraceae bacterium]
MTVCTSGRRCLFGQIENGEIRSSLIGVAVASCWEEIPRHFDNVVLDAFALMPNHLHGILILTDPVGAGHARPLPTIVGSFKSRLAGGLARQFGNVATGNASSGTRTN